MHIEVDQDAVNPTNNIFLVTPHSIHVKVCNSSLCLSFNEFSITQTWQSEKIDNYHICYNSNKIFWVIDRNKDLDSTIEYLSQGSELFRHYAGILIYYKLQIEEIINKQERERNEK